MIAMIPIIDADVIVYRSGFRAQHTEWVATNLSDMYSIEFGPRVTKAQASKLMMQEGLKLGEWVLEETLVVDPVEHACHSAKITVQMILNRFEATSYKLYLTSNDKSNYRFKVAKTRPYKGNRTAPKPVHYDAIREYLLQCWNAELVTGIEADDAMGIEQCRHLPGESVICSIDKDMNIIRGHHYNFVTDVLYTTTYFGHLELYDLGGNKAKKSLRGGGLKWFYAQMLLGDSADNIPGVSMCGPVKVFKLLSECKTEEELYKTVLKVYTNKQIEGRFEEVANLLWIQQKENAMWRKPC
jgi:hypothetical protein